MKAAARCLFYTLCALLLLAEAACTRDPPMIDYWNVRTVYHQANDGIVPGLIFFVIVNDSDGPEDIDELRLYHDGEGLMWRFTAENWIKLEDSGKTWIGSKSIRMPPGEIIPSGQYRAVLIDKAGEKGEKSFGYEAPQDSRYRFPKLVIEGGNYTVTSDYPENYLLCYHSDGAFRNMIKLDSKSGVITSLRLASDVFSIALWADDLQNNISSLTLPVNVR